MAGRRKKNHSLRRICRPLACCCARPRWCVAAVALLAICSHCLQTKNVATLNSDVELNHASFLSGSSSSPWKRELLARLKRIQTACGELCAIADKASHMEKIVDDGATFPRMEARVNCSALMGSEDIDAEDNTVPYPPPNELLPYYTLGGMIEFVAGHRHESVCLGNKAEIPVWTQEMVETHMLKAANGTLKGSCGEDWTTMVRDMLRKQLDLSNKSVLVIGSQCPWLESICLELGATNVTTLECGATTSEHPQIRTMIPLEFRQAHRENRLEKFDVIATISSLEHSGLGRHGDALNPWGDVLAVARAWCVTKPGGKMLLGLPSGKIDQVIFNGHRVYGKVRWPLITANWKQLHTFDDFPDTPNLRSGYFFEKL